MCDSPSAPPRVGIVVVGHNDSDWLPSCLDALQRSTYRYQQVVFVDNASADGSAEMIRRGWPHVRVVCLKRNAGFAGGNNVGIRLPALDGCDFFFLVNPDARCPPDLVSKLVSFCLRRPRYGVVGPLEVKQLSRPYEWSNWTRRAVGWGGRPYFARWLPGLSERLEDVEEEGVIRHSYVHGSSFFVRREALAMSGLFDETFGTFYEEVDLCRRIEWTGYRIGLVPDLHIEHRGRDLDSYSWYRVYHKTRNRYYLALTEPSFNNRDRVVTIRRMVLVDLREIIDGSAAGRWKKALALSLSVGWLIARFRAVLAQLRWRAKLFTGVQQDPPASVPDLPRQGSDHR